MERAERDGKIVFVTGISGAGVDEALSGVHQFAEKKGKQTRNIVIADKIFEHAADDHVPLTKENILNSDLDHMQSMRGGALREIYNDINRRDLRKKYDATFIKGHSLFLWKDFYDDAWDSEKIQMFESSMYCTVIDDVGRILKRLQSRKQWEGQNLTKSKLMTWTNLEVITTRRWAREKKTPYYAIPATSPPSLLYRLAFESDIEKVYVSMPLTHGYTKKIQEEVDRLVEGLEKSFVVFDPRRVDPISTTDSGAEIDVQTSRMITRRDLDWFVGPSDIVVVYFPKIVLSWGAVDETNKAHRTNKYTWLIWPHKDIPSPFAQDDTHRIFESPEALLEYVEKRQQQKTEKQT